MCVCVVLSEKFNPQFLQYNLVHVFSAPFRATSARNLVVFNVKLVVIREFLAGDDASKGENYDVFLTEDVNNF